MLHLGQVLVIFEKLLYKGSARTQESSNHGYEVFLLARHSAFSNATRSGGLPSW